MVFLRPQFLYVFAALLLFFLLKAIFEETSVKTYHKALLLMVVQTLLIIIYCFNFKVQYGIFSLSDAMPRQNLKICIDRGYYTQLENAEMVALIQSYQKGENVYNENWAATGAVVAVYGNAEVNTQAKQFFRRHFAEYVKDTLEILIEDTTTAFTGYGIATYTANTNPNAPGIVQKILRLQKALFGNATIGQALAVAVLNGAAMVYVWRCNKRPPWLHMALFSISVCTTWLTYFLTCFEYMRTMISVLPYFAISCAIFAQWAGTQVRPEQS